MQIVPAIHNTWNRGTCLTALLLLAPTLHAAFLPQSFIGAEEPNWNLSGTAKLTASAAAAIDPDGQGWLRLTENVKHQVGEALYQGDFPSTDGIIVAFDYVMWNTGSYNVSADGISIFLYDPSIPSLMDDATNGAGLGYCHGAAGILGIGLDTEAGNFAKIAPTVPAHCKTGLVGERYNAITLRGSFATDNAIIGSPITVSEPIYSKFATSRPDQTRSVQLSILPLPSAAGYHITLFEGPTGGDLTSHDLGDYTEVLPARLSIGLAGSTGDATQVNEVRMLRVTKPIDVSVTTTAPVLNGRTASHTVTLKNKPLDSGAAIPIVKESDAPLLSQTVDPNLTNISWTCRAEGAGTTCPSPSGTGAFQNLGNYLLGQSGILTFTVTGTVACESDSVQAHSATADFPQTSEYEDAYPLDNNDSASGRITTDSCGSPASNVTPVPLLEHVALVLLSLMAAGLGAIGLHRRATQSTR